LAYGRPAAPEVYLPRDIDVPTLVQETTRRIVELIKVLIEYSTTKDVQGMQLTVSAIYSEVQDMTAYIVLIVSTTDLFHIVIFAFNFYL